MALIISSNDHDTLALLRTSEIAITWPTVAPVIQRAIDRNFGEHELADIREQLDQRDMLLFILYRNRDNEILATCVLSIVEYAHVRACRIVILAGFDMEEWAHHESEIESWAMDHGCERIEAVCRPGFKRMMKPFGYESRYVTLIKDLNLVRH